jgi:hypothetical protein
VDLSSDAGSVYLLDVVVRQRAAVLELLAGEDQALLVRGDALLVLDLALHIVDGVAGLDLERDGLAREGLDEAVSRGSVLHVVRWACRCCGASWMEVGGGAYICTVGSLSVPSFH